MQTASRSGFRTATRWSYPRSTGSYCTRRVLTMEAIDGPTVNTLDLSGFSPEERRRLAETIAHAWFRQILHDGFFHADPHPGNIVVLAPDRIGLLDFGMAGSLSEEDLEDGTVCFTAIVSRDLRAVKRHLRRLGLRWPPERRRPGVSEALEQVFSRYYGTVLGQVDPAAVFREVFDIIYTLHLQLPTRFLLLEKALVTLEGVVGEIYADLNVFDLARPYARRPAHEAFPAGSGDRAREAFDGRLASRSCRTTRARYTTSWGRHKAESSRSRSSPAVSTISSTSSTWSPTGSWSRLSWRPLPLPAPSWLRSSRPAVELFGVSVLGVVGFGIALGLRRLADVGDHAFRQDVIHPEGCA